jgi:hypothetical protein
MVIYIVYIRPLIDYWEANHWILYNKMSLPSDFIWHDETGLWNSSQISRAVAKWTYYYISRRITFQDWQHIAIAISKRHACQRGVIKADFEDINDNGAE